MKNRKMIILAILVLICIVTSISIHKNYEGKNIEEIKEKTNKNNKLVFWIEQDDGNYKEDTNGAFPVGDYLINTEKTKCTSLEDKQIKPTITYQNGIVTVTGQNTAYCEIYFDKCKGPVGTVLADKEQVSKCEVGGMYRYQGTDSVDNYICFGTTDQETCKNNASKYMYRIIGVTPEGQLKLIKETALIAMKEPEWDYSTSTMKNSINGSDFLTNSDYLSKVWQDLIVSHNWLYGFTGKVNDSDLYNGNYMYEIESGKKEVTFDSSVEYGSSGSYSYTIKTTTKKWDTSVSDKVGLLYIHDYLFAYLGGNPGSSNNLKTIWLAPKIPEFIITAQGLSDVPNAPGHRIYLWNNYLTTDYSNLSYLKSGKAIDFGLRPVFYLNNDLKIKNGAGSNIDPYILDVVDDSPSPTCSFNVTTSGVTLVPSNATSWYMSTTATSNPNYGTS